MVLCIRGSVMNEVIVVASGKGGTGKSTVSVCLAAALVKYNKKVLLVDCDCGMRGLDLLLDVKEDILFDCADAVCGNCEVKEAVYQSKNSENLYLMAAPFDIENEISPTIFKQLIEQVKQDFDYVIIDSPAGIGSGLATAASSADRALIVTNPEPASVSGGKKVAIKLKSFNIQDIRLVINRFDKEQFFDMDIYFDLDEVIDEIGAQLIALIPFDKKIPAITQKGGVGRNWCPAITVFDCLARRIMGHEVDLAYY